MLFRSDQIRAEMHRLSERTGLSIVVSMGDAAASGGYWISADADLIVANPLTLTGSIGVVSMKPVFARLLEKREVHRESYRRGAMTDMFSPWRPMTAEEREAVEKEINATYDIFLDEVSRARGIPRADVEEVAGGRVWFGRAAADHRLVDRIGTVEDAVTEAATRAGIRDDFRTLYFTGQRTSLLARLAGGVEYIRAFGGFVGLDGDDPGIETAD